ncbi:MAG: c-type cytochrome [Nitrospinae bacterium]|nr:c-type cytochrome [Nitrospinota bacterium]
MKQIKLFIAIIIGSAVLWGNTATAGEIPAKPKIPNTPEAIEAGKKIYFRRCSFCHGLEGKGDGPVSDQLLPRPRDFTTGLFKLRTTVSGELPVDEDLFRAISRGLTGSAMQPFDIDKIKSGLTEEERWQVIYYIKTFSEDFKDPDRDPTKQLVKVSKQIPSSPESIAKGKELFQKMKCWECHGENARGNGPNAPRLKTKDGKNDPILPADLSKFWRYKGGSTVNDIYMRFNTGLNGTPMPSFTDSLSDEERWHLANYVVSLQKKEIKSGVLTTKIVKGDIPLDTENPIWATAEPIDMMMSGQVVVAPRWENPSVDLVTVKAVYNDKEIGFLFEWSDRFKDTAHKTETEVNFGAYQAALSAKPAGYHSYVKWQEIPRDIGNFRDSIAIQFSAKPMEGTEKPHFVRGDTSKSVNLWVWKSELQEEGKGSPVEDSNVNGFQKPFTPQSPEGQQVKGAGVWKDGQWKVVMVRPLTTPDKNDIQFEKGKFIPFALNAWDGSNGEHGLAMSVSSWNYILLETSTPTHVYLYTFLSMALIGGAEVWLVRRKNGR